MVNIESIKKYIADNSTDKAREFSMRLIATQYEISGMQSPAAKKLTKDTLNGAYGEPIKVLEALPDDSYELIGLQGAIIAKLNIPLLDKEHLIENFVKKIDNWATNDSFVSAFKIPKTEREAYYRLFTRYAKGEGEFPIRFGVTGLMDNYLDDEHIDNILETLKTVIDGAYYVKMAVAWTIATALAKYYDKTLKFILDGGIADKWTHNKAIQKAIESYRLSNEQKVFLKTLKRK